MLENSTTSASHDELSESLLELSRIIASTIDWSLLAHNKSSDRKSLTNSIHILRSLCSRCGENSAIKLNCLHKVCIECAKLSLTGFFCAICSYELTSSELGLLNEILQDSIRCKACARTLRLFDYYYTEMHCLCCCKECTRSRFLSKQQVCDHQSDFQNMKIKCGRCRSDFFLRNLTRNDCPHIYCEICSEDPCIDCLR